MRLGDKASCYQGANLPKDNLSSTNFKNIVMQIKTGKPAVQENSTESAVQEKSTEPALQDNSDKMINSQDIEPDKE
ncbi:771_t:CDS:2 [Dentiscutata heterogama]|uniref:771_t:CDS:1 n=1 Tax=Dentiscutata heterogama TaxID=1316150 RepID=A0ACA9MNX7_9GLOM|nr:771_t:CDS:2 [Dentiscutata heterogama]